VGITFGRLSPSYWIDNLGFLLRENLAAIFITPSSWGSQLAGHLLGISAFQSWMLPLRMMTYVGANSDERWCSGADPG
jgi:hypothetical protein